jgi:hypothetical protein
MFLIVYLLDIQIGQIYVEEYFFIVSCSRFYDHSIALHEKEGNTVKKVRVRNYLLVQHHDEGN